MKHPLRLSYVIAALEEYAPGALQEKWDNSGLQIGLPDGDGECTGALLCVDVTESVIEEAARLGCNLVVSHHPLIFKGLRRIAGSTVTERAAMAVIRSGIAVYSAHTSLDSTMGGVSYAMASRLGAEVERVLVPSELQFKRISVTCPRELAASVRLVLLDHDAGTEPCSDNSSLSPTAPVADTDSAVSYYDCEEESLPKSPGPEPGVVDIRHTALTRVEAVVPAWKCAGLAASVTEIPGAESAKIDILPLDNQPANLGLGVLASFPQPVSMAELADKIKKEFGCRAIRVSAAYAPDAKVRRIALCGGAGGEFIGKARSAGAQAYISADIRYHDFADNRSGMAIFDIGHFESESCAKDIFYHVLTNKFANFAVYYSEIESNPVKYL